MIDLTPLDVRKKRGDFKRGIRGYDSEEVDTFLELVAERLEELVRANISLEERVEHLDEQVKSQEGREKAVNDALVTAQQLREEIQGQARREADSVIDDSRRMADSTVGNAQAEANAILDRARSDSQILRRELDYEIEVALRDANRRLQEAGEALEALERARSRFLKGLRSTIERQMDALEVEEARPPMDQPAPELDLPAGWREEALSRGGEGRDHGYLKVPGLLDDDLGGLVEPRDGIGEVNDSEAVDGPRATPEVPTHVLPIDDDSGENDMEGEEGQGTDPTEDDEGFEVREYGVWTQPIITDSERDNGFGDRGENSS